ncbi:MAG: glycosyltransferase [Pyrinomonadaceae bacterium]|nr:glycosyltransferase [Pyrinomonadaceae bacterium]
MMQKVYILLPVHNRSIVTEHFIDCLAAQSYSNYHLILIDDGSTDGTEEMVQAKIKHLTVLKGQGDWWWAGSLQQGINWLEQHGVEDRDIVMFANDDITFEDDFLQKAVGILENLDGALLLPHLRDEITGLPQESGVEADLNNLTFTPAASPDKINCLSTRGLFMRICDLKKIGEFHPRLLPQYLSDYEFTIRARRKGLTLITNGEIAIQLDREQTGYRSTGDDNLIHFTKRLFSKKHVSNPIYRSTFILLTVPKSHIPVLLLKVWIETAKMLLYRSTRRFRNHPKKNHTVYL